MSDLPSLTLAATHCPWVPERRATMARFREAVGVAGAVERDPTIRTFGYDTEVSLDATRDLPSGMLAYREERERATNDVWSERVWEWSASREVDWCAFGQEDVILAPGFWPKLRAMLAVLPESAEIVGLHANHPLCLDLARMGHRWATTSDGLVGPFYAIRRASLASFLAWRAEELRDGWRTPAAQGLPHLTEDTMLGVWCLVTGRRIWHPIPTLIDHDTTIPSTGGNDHHPHRRPAVTWESSAWKGSDGAAMDDPAFWHPVGSPPHLGRFYGMTPTLAWRWVKNLCARDFRRMHGDIGAEAKEAISEFRAGPRATASDAAPTRVCLIPLIDDGRVHYSFVATALRASKAPGVRLMGVRNAASVAGDRALRRARLLRAGLESDAEAFWLLAGDIDVSSAALVGMLATGRPIVGVPYPTGDADYGVEPIDGEDLAPDACVKVESMPLGCAVIRREALERMVDVLEVALGFDDADDMEPDMVAPTCDLFRPRRPLDFDQSFCERVRSVGLDVAAYFGPGSPATRYGAAVYRGDLGAFGLSRATEA